MNTKSWLRMASIAVWASLISAPYPAHGAAILTEQTDGSAFATGASPCDNACSDVVVASQKFSPQNSGYLGSLEVFTSNFSSYSRYPETNSCYIRIYNQDTDSMIAASDNGFNGYDCAGEKFFTFKNSAPFIEAGSHLRWDFVFGAQNFSSITFAGTSRAIDDSSFSIAPVANAKFELFAAVQSPVGLTQYIPETTSSIPQGGSATDTPYLTFGATLPSVTPDILRLQVELQPSYVPFTNVPNLVISRAVHSGSLAHMASDVLPNGPYHWQARAIDTKNNDSPWRPMTPVSSSSISPPMPDFFMNNPANSLAIIQDNFTRYAINTQPNPCFGNGTLFSCNLAPEHVHYQVAAPFKISKITFNWSNDGANNCDNLGNYGALITASEATSSLIASSTNTVYVGCPRGGANLAELRFATTSIPASFFLTLGAFDGALQGGSNVAISNVQIYPAQGTEASGTIAASSTDPASLREPVVIIPGILGSQLARSKDAAEAWPNIKGMALSLTDGYLDDLKLDASGRQIPGKELSVSDILRAITAPSPFPGQAVYEPLISALSSAGYREGTDLFIAPYDWRLDIASSATAIDPVIKAAIAYSQNGKINVIAHSMGGLVAKYYLAHATSTAFMDKLILAGTPQLGAPKMFKSLQYGDDLGFHLGPVSLLNPHEAKSIAQNMPSAYELLPSERYVSTQGSYVIDTRSGMSKPLTSAETNGLMTADPSDARNGALLDVAAAFHAGLDSAPVNAPEVYNIIGCQQPATIGGFVIEDGGIADIIRAKGDGTVPIASALSLANGYHNYFSLYGENKADHIGLVNNGNALALITAIIGNATSSLALQPLGISTSTQDCFEGRSAAAAASTMSTGAITTATIEVSAHSPIALHAYDASGNHTGPSSDEDQYSGIDLRIPGSGYEALGENSFITLPASGMYRIEGDGYQQGAFTLKVKEYDSAGDLMKETTYVREPLAQASTSVSLALAPGFAAPMLSIASSQGTTSTAPTAILDASSSADIAPPVIIMPDIPRHVPSGTPVTIAFSASDDLSGIASLTATLDGSPIENGAIIKNIPLGDHIIEVDAFDNAGNPRIQTLSFAVITPDSNNSENALSSSAPVMVPSGGNGNGGSGGSFSSNAASTTIAHCKKRNATSTAPQ